MHGPTVSNAPTTHSPAGVGVRLHDVRKVFEPDVVAVEGLTLEVAAGDFVALLGPSGCGKSTLLRIIAGLERAQTGRIDIRGEARMAFVFQDAHLLPWRTVLDNAALPLELLGASRRDRRDAAQQALEQVGLADALTRYPAQLSGGMRMRVSLARALVTQPRLLLLDEPFAALDEITRASLDLQLRDLWRQRRMTVLFVTHSVIEAAFLAQRAVVLTRRPARIVADLTLDLPDERGDALRTDAHFAGQMRLLHDALRQGGAA